MGIHISLIFDPKHTCRLWVLVRSASAQSVLRRKKMKFSIFTTEKQNLCILHGQLVFAMLQGTATKPSVVV